MNNTQIKITERWDLDNIYPSFAVWKSEYNNLLKKIDNFSSYHKQIKNKLYDAITELHSIERQLSKIYLYPKLKYDLDCLNNDNIMYFNQVNDLISQYSFKTNFFTIELLKISNSDLNQLFINNPKLKEYEFIIEKIRNEKKHYLSLKEENIISLTDQVRNTQERIFDKLNDADVNFGLINGVELNHGNYHNFITSVDVNVRKDAFTMYHQYYKNHFNTLSECLITQVKNNLFLSKTRKYKNPMNMYLDSDKINNRLYINLIKSVHKNLNLLHEYLKLKKDELNIKEMHMYDMYVKVNEPLDKKYTYEEAKDIVLNSLKPFGDELVNIASIGLNNNWVDVYPNKGKTSGAYSSGCYDTKPYILLNFNHTFSSVETLAHELGHSIHSYYSRVNQPYQYSDYSIFLAEIASNTHELLLFNYLLQNSNSKQEKKYILEIILDSFRASIFRQTHFAEFEMIIHDRELNNDTLTNQGIIDIYYDLNKKYYDKVLFQDELIKYEALRIPHFYSSFYVYKYAIGLAVAHVFASRIINNKTNAINEYIDFISAGSSKYPLDVLKRAGIDVNSVVDDAFKLMKHYLDEYKKL